jgi:hypothetical protein
MLKNKQKVRREKYVKKAKSRVTVNYHLLI